MARTSQRRFDPSLEAHKTWMGLVQPVGLVVAPPALLKAGVVPDQNVGAAQQALLSVLERPATAWADPDPVLADVPRFVAEVLGWYPEELAGAPDQPPVPDALTVPLPDYGETLRPTYALLDGGDPERPVLLVTVVERGTDLDKPASEATGPGWHASPQARFERLLRGTRVPAGLLCNGEELRLVYAPSGESSGHIGFPLAEMTTVGGRPILAALVMLLGVHRLLDAPEGERLLDLMAESRTYQSEVSNRLSEQVLGALWELLRGVQAADDAANGRVLHGLARTDPEQVYGGLLTVILRLVFLLYAEDQGLMPASEVYARNYSVGGLYERLREDAGRYPDTMDQRYGAWAWLLATFRIVFDGGGHGDLRLPTRHGQLFNPDEYPFLEGRPPGVPRVVGEVFEAPRVSDGVVWRVLEGLLVLDGERLSYRSLDVEQVGSVYESMMGFDVRTTRGPAVALRPKNIVVDLDELLAQPAHKRTGWLKEQALLDLSGAAAKALEEASRIDEAVAALERRLAPPTPRPLPPGALFLQPGEERRRSGSHYTPRELTEPIVRTTLEPVLAALGERARPEQILDLKVCDPAMGSGAFLVEACRQLAAALVQAWETHQCLPSLPPDEDPLLHARRLVAQRCLYGVDKNRFAVNLAKLSLWLVTLARDHAFTFLDHALKHGDALVGLTREQIAAFHWAPTSHAQLDWIVDKLKQDLERALGWRAAVHEKEEGAYDERRAAWREAEDAVHAARRIGDACVAAFFGAAKPKEREKLRSRYRGYVDAWNAGGDAGHALDDVVDALRGGERPLPPLHWEVEFPEVFRRANPGFDAFVGNPPFAGKNTIIAGNREGYVAWLHGRHEGSHGNADLVAHFYRRAFSLLRSRGTMGLIATNTICQGDTRFTGLRWICTKGGEIYHATRRVQWPGIAAVVVSVVHVHKGPWRGERVLDGRQVPEVTAFLFHAGGHENPVSLRQNAGLSFQGSIVLGMGFTFDDTDSKGVANPLAERERLIAKDPRNAERIFPYIGGQEINSSPTHAHHRYVINFGDMSEKEARRWPDLMKIVEERVKPERMKQNRDVRKKYWWRFGEAAPALYESIDGLERVLANSQVSSRVQFAFCDAGSVFGHTANVFPLDTYAAFCALQSRPHELWARFFGSSLEDRLRYTPSDCFETFPFPRGWMDHADLEAAGEAYYGFRAELMVRNEEGLTKTYNRFHDPDERDPDILRLRELHAAMDRAVLDAYGWTDVPTECDFFLDYEIDEATWGTKKKPWRYRWPDDVHDEVLARLLDLNHERAHAEAMGGGCVSDRQEIPAATQATPNEAAPPPRRAPKKAGPSGPLPLFDPPVTDE